MNKRQFKDGTYSQSGYTEYELGPNDIPSQVFYRMEYTECPIIVQVGANDGVCGEQYGFMSWLDSLNDFKLFLCEPLLEDYERLKEVYKKFGDKVVYCNYAITENSGETFMDLDSRDSGCSRINPSGSTKIKTKSWEEFVNENYIENIDILLIDCEGYEWNVFYNCMDFDEVSPKKIRYEYCHLPNQLEVDNFLKSRKYKIELCQCDPTFNKVCTLKNN